MVEAPPRTRGFRDLWRGSESIETQDGEIHGASVLDLLRIADASTRLSARIEALAYQAVLDVHTLAATRPPLAGVLPPRGSKHG